MARKILREIDNKNDKIVKNKWKSFAALFRFNFGSIAMQGASTKQSGLSTFFFFAWRHTFMWPRDGWKLLGNAKLYALKRFL